MKAIHTNNISLLCTIVLCT